jgi:hypothetical protein
VDAQPLFEEVGLRFYTIIGRMACKMPTITSWFHAICICAIVDLVWSMYVLPFVLRMHFFSNAACVERKRDLSRP